MGSFFYIPNFIYKFIENQYFLSVKTLLVGNFGARNVGDEMILASALERHPDAIVATADGVFSQRFQEKEFETVLPYPTGFRSWLRYIFKKEGTLRALEYDIDRIIFPGGGLFAINNKAWWIWGVTIMGLRRVFPHAKVEMQAQGIDIPKNWWQRFWLRRVLSAIESISVRDKASAEVMDAFKQETDMVGDAVVKWLKDKTSNDELETSKKEFVLVNARARFIDAPWPQADVYLAMEPRDAQWIPMGFEGKIIFPETVRETIDVFSSAKQAIGQRLHFLLLAKACGCPDIKVLGEPYAEKVKAWKEASRKAGLKTTN